MDISNRDDVIDSRQVIERIEELQAEIADTPDSMELEIELAGFTELAEQGAEMSTEWEDGETLIRHDYFEAFARELVEDCGYFNTDRSEYSRHGETYAPDFNAWPYRCIDWERVADELKADYATIQFDGVDYWIRSV